MKIVRWLVISIGALIVGLAGLWINTLFGPESTSDPCYEYSPNADFKFVQEKIEMTRKKALKQSSDPLITNAINDDTNIVFDKLNFQKWVVECGKSSMGYPRTYNSPVIGKPEIYTVVPYNLYKDNDGRDCRKIKIYSKINEETLKPIEHIFCQEEGQWIVK